MGHTPTPWVCRQSFDRPTIWFIEGRPGWYVAETTFEEDAALIVRAVNAHEELLDIAKRALNHSARVHPDFAEQIRAAIAKAEGS